jgi:hypothetical protein
VNDADESPRRPAARRSSGLGTASSLVDARPAGWGWRLGAVLALLVAGAAAGQWLWQTARSGPSTAPAPVLQQASQQTSPQTPAVVQARAAAAPGGAKRPVPWTTLAELLQRPASASLRWSRFEPNPAIVVIEYPNLREQGLAMNRLAAMFEKRSGRRDRVLTEVELDELMRRSGDTVASFYQGHDYPAAKVARFFTLAETQRMTLNAQEAQLRALLLESGFMKRGATGDFQAMGEQAVVSFTGVQQDDPATKPDETIDGLRREAVLRHELSHGEFFTNAEYRAHSMKFWRQELREQERRIFVAYLASLDYNAADEELMANETQAMLMHTPDTRAFNAASLGVGESTLADLRSRFRRGEPAHGLRR